MSKTNQSYRESLTVRVNYTKVGLIKAKQKKVRRGSPLLKKVSPQDWDSDWGSLLLNQQWQPLDFFALWEEDTGSTWPIVDCLRRRTQLFFKFWKVDISMTLLFIFQNVVKLNIAVVRKYKWTTPTLVKFHMFVGRPCTMEKLRSM